MGIGVLCNPFMEVSFFRDVRIFVSKPVHQHFQIFHLKIDLETHLFYLKFGYIAHLWPTLPNWLRKNAYYGVI